VIFFDITSLLFWSEENCSWSASIVFWNLWWTSSI